MKNNIKIRFLHVFSIAYPIIIILFFHMAYANVDLTPVRQINIGFQALDIATSEDGKLVFVLAPEKVLVYSLKENKIINSIPLADTFDRITYSVKNNQLILTSSTSKILKIIQVESIYDIDISGRPFKGPAGAPVTIAIFDDYQ
jgi:hypothetical protein